MSPHHLQQQELFFEATLAARLAALETDAWGVTAMGIDEAALKGGQFRLQEFAGVFPSGMALEIRPTDAGAPPSRPLEEHFASTAAVLEVFLAVAGLREGIVNYGDDAEHGIKTRYRTVSRSVNDLTASHTELQVAFGRANLQILVGKERRDDFETIKIAEIVRDATGSLALSETYIPPCLRLDASPWLSNALQNLLGIALVKQRALAETRRQRDAASVEFAASDVTQYLLLNALNCNIPLLRHFTDTFGARPLAAYLALVQLAGQLSSFTTGVDPSTFPRFNHTDLRATFQPLLQQIGEMLGAAVRERTVPIPLEARKDGMWIGMLKDERLPKCPVFVLAVESDNSEQDVANRLPQLSKIASWKQISQIVQSATPGVPLQATHRPPPEVAIRPRVVYFVLGTDDVHWRAIVSERTIALYFPPPFDPSRARLSLVGVPARTA